MSYRSPEEEGRRSARRFYANNPYHREPARSEWQRGYDAEHALILEEDRAKAVEANRLASRSIYDMLGEGDTDEAIRRIAEHLGILYDTPS